MSDKKKRNQNIVIFLKSAGLTAISLLLIALGFIAAGYFFGG